MLALWPCAVSVSMTFLKKRKKKKKKRLRSKLRFLTKGPVIVSSFRHRHGSQYHTERLLKSIKTPMQQLWVVQLCKIGHNWTLAYS